MGKRERESKDEEKEEGREKPGREGGGAKPLCTKRIYEVGNVYAFLFGCLV